MDDLTSTRALIVRQVKEWGEILTGFETVNRYLVTEEDGKERFYVGERPGSFLVRIFLKALRPFEMDLYDPRRTLRMKLRRPFRFFFHRVDVHDGTGRPLGSVERRFSLLRRIYTVKDPAGREELELFGPILHPWTFEIRQGGQSRGKITKKWSGLLKETFTDADNFGITFPEEWEPRLKAVLLGAVFLIDFVHFENKNKS